MKTILTVLGTLLTLVLLFLIFIYSGSYDPSALSKHNGLTKWVIHTTMHHSIKSRIKDIQVPGNLNDSTLIKIGFQHYNEMCAGCHGAPGVKPFEGARGLYPDAPHIYKFASRMHPKSTFWVTKNGIKMTGMPTFGPTHSDQKIWAITAFITQKLGKMTPEEYKAWQNKYKDDDDD